MDGTLSVIIPKVQTKASMIISAILVSIPQMKWQTATTKTPYQASKRLKRKEKKVRERRKRRRRRISSYNRKIKLISKAMKIKLIESLCRLTKNWKIQRRKVVEVVVGAVEVVAVLLRK
jgi:hypothetical protein